VIGPTETIEAKPNQLANTKGDKKMKQDTLKQVSTSEENEAVEIHNNVLNFTSTLKELRKTRRPESGQTARRLARPQRQHALR
jgi:hypothetical protein